MVAVGGTAVGGAIGKAAVGVVVGAGVGVGLDWAVQATKDRATTAPSIQIPLIMTSLQCSFAANL
jgi:hypothetical protein